MLKELVPTNQRLAELTQGLAKLAQKLVKLPGKPSELPKIPPEQLSRQLTELVQKFVKLPQKSSDLYQKDEKKDELVQQLVKMSQELSELFQKKLNKKVDAVHQNLVELCKNWYRGPNLRIEIPSHKIRQAQNSSQFSMIKGQAISGCLFPPLRVDCFVACDWRNLGELEENTINIVDHLHKLLPREGKGIGLVTFQNGMMNSSEECAELCRLINGYLPENPLCIGLHNPTTGKIPIDMLRFKAEQYINIEAVHSLRQLRVTFANLLPQINPNLLWLHIAHSEGGLIANVVHRLFEDWRLSKEREYIKNHLITATYGAVMPVPDNVVHHVVNTYSKDDIAMFFYGRTYLDTDFDKIKEDSYTSRKTYEGKHYTVTIVKSERVPLVRLPEVLTREQRLNMSWFEWLGYSEELEDRSHTAALLGHLCHSIIDHGFKEKTYQNALEDDLRKFRGKYGIYNAKKVY